MKKKIPYFVYSIWMTISFIGMIYFLYRMFYGMSSMVNPYISNPFLVLTTCMFSFYLAWKKMSQCGCMVGICKWDIAWLLLTGLNIYIWYRYNIHIDKGMISHVCRWIMGCNILLWLIYLFLPKKKRYCANILIFYFFLSAVLYYFRNVFI